MDQACWICLLPMLTAMLVSAECKQRDAPQKLLGMPVSAGETADTPLVCR